MLYFDISRYAAFDPVKTHQRWCPVLDVNPDDGVPLWKLIYNRVSPDRKQLTHVYLNKRLMIYGTSENCAGNHKRCGMC
ncbi:hypothetical protein ANCDUO_27196 [Ancylostoma duodenale]|uniref:Uncharacterized protein n=1 Tax=Ancylostoma duodenale TaxID=51022 RepID=A0A0C2F795_9BILA|nr:hypothetical protein ANCDUO_27196 [Ancylostoma duodenale]